ncbi:MAG TPA: transcriptional regulator NrdR [Verrucomicrobiota bacterium]|nr:transcriptional regulator NrdR [Verrucomicrobiales bacterium]HRI12340.1 transcriptional regulator NrdR [Verrucomicrobiota bacterium]
MRCPKCGGQDDKVIDSRASREGSVIRRRRECLNCEQRFTTYEEIEREELFVVKRDGRREPFSKEKLLSGLKRACQKRPVSEEAVADAVERVTNEITERFDREVPAKVIGERVMRELRELDAVAYVRFASIYREFQEVGEFVDEVNRLATLPPPDKRQMAFLADSEETDQLLPVKS